MVVSREELKKEQSSIIKSLSNITKNKKLVEGVIQQFQKAEIECYYNLETSDEYFLDVIIIRKSSKNLSGLLRECDSLSAKLSRDFGRSIEVYECGYKKVGNFFGLFVDFDGAFYGTRSFVFYLPNSRNEVIAIGGTCKNQILRVFKKEYEDILGSLKIK